jgi:hypothetical protein
MSVWTQFFYLPLTVLVYGLDFMVQTLRAFQQTAQQVVVSDPNTGSSPLIGGGLTRSTPIGGVQRGDATTTLKEVRKMSDCGCGCGDQCGEKFCEVRVYEYYIISVRPCHEEVVYGPTSIIVTNNMSGEAFSSYAIAMYCTDPRNKITKENAQYLRVCYRINCTFPKERKDCCKDDQAQALSDIRDILRDHWGGGTKGTTTSTTSAAGETGTTGTTGKGGRGDTATVAAGA